MNCILSIWDVGYFLKLRVYNMQSGGPSYAVELGRLDGLSSTAASVNGKLPQPTFNLDQLNALFGSHGLTQTDMIALSGTLLPPSKQEVQLRYT